MALDERTREPPSDVHRGQVCPVCYSLPKSSVEHGSGVVVIELLCPSGHIWRVTYLGDGKVSA